MLCSYYSEPKTLKGCPRTVAGGGARGLARHLHKQLDQAKRSQLSSSPSARGGTAGHAVHPTCVCPWVARISSGVATAAAKAHLLRSPAQCARHLGAHPSAARLQARAVPSAVLGPAGGALALSQRRGSHFRLELSSLPQEGQLLACAWSSGCWRAQPPSRRQHPMAPHKSASTTKGKEVAAAGRAGPMRNGQIFAWYSGRLN